MAKVLRLLIIVVVLAGAAGAIYAWVGSRGTDENGNTLIEAEIGSITEKALAVGQIEPRERFQVKSKISGIVARCFVEVGDSVGAGDALFEIAPDPLSLASLETNRIAKTIYPAGFYNTKAGQLKEIAHILTDQHGSEVPASEDALLALPGVGRKTANLVLGLGFGIPAICVDTHVHRISNRLGLVATKTPEKTEKALNDVLPEDTWIPINDLLVTFGQNQCHPTSPRCSSCPLDDLCPRVGVTRFR